MNIDNRLELQPVLYGNLPIKLLEFSPVAHMSVFEMHWHTRLEMLIIHDGMLEVTVGDKQITATKGEIVLINPQTIHAARTQESSVSYRVVMFELDSFINDKTAERILAPFKNFEKQFVNHINDAEVFSICAQIYRLTKDKSQGFELKIIGLIYQILGILINKYTEATNTALNYSEDFSEIKEYISDHFCDNISTASISDHFGYNEAYFCRRFKQVTGLSPLKYIKILRLEKAKKLLQSSKKSLLSIASECGFATPDYLSKCFKAHYGMTPMDYRAKRISFKD